MSVEKLAAPGSIAWFRGRVSRIEDAARQDDDMDEDDTRLSSLVRPADLSPPTCTHAAHTITYVVRGMVALLRPCDLFTQEATRR
jgi:hypothetical protein